MSDERRYYEYIRHKASRAQERLAQTLAQTRIASARDKRAKDHGGTTRLSGRPDTR
jgi:hypothetical protein